MNTPATKTNAIAELTPAYIMIAETEQGYLAIAEKILKARLMPRGFDTPQQASIAMMAGREFGLSALQSLSGFAVVNGRAVPWGVTLRGICMAKVGAEPPMVGISACIIGVGEMRHVALEPDEDGELERELGRALRRALLRRLARHGHTYDGETKKWTAEGASVLPKNYGCGYAAVKRAGRPVRCELFDSAEAQTAGLLSKSGPWSQFPTRMLEARAMTFCLRGLYSDRLSGLDTTADELDDITVSGPAAPATATSSALDELVTAGRGSEIHDAEFSERQPEESPEARERRQDAEEAKEAHRAAEGDLPHTARGLAGLTGHDTLRTVVQRIKAAGGSANDFQEAACMRSIGEVKSGKAMTDAEKLLVAVALAQIWDDNAARLQDEAARAADMPTDPPAGAPPAPDSEVDF